MIAAVVGIALYRWRNPVVIIPDGDVPLASYSDSELYRIENEKFGISSNGKNARETTDGINEAIQWAKENGYRGVALSSGTYLIACDWNDPNTLPDDGILVPSDTILSLGNAVLKMEANSQPAYNLIYTLKGENIIIDGGILVGDKDSHRYSGWSTHEWGTGVNIVASRDVTVQNMTIYNMTGDAVTVRGGSLINSSDFHITENRLYDCRRQGVSVTGGVNGTITGNTIYNISGTDPQSGIDIEANFGYSATGLMIQGNRISNCKGASIQCYNGSNYSVVQNECVNGGILIGSRTSGVKVEENILKNSRIRILGRTTNVQLSENRLDSASVVEYR